MANKWIAHKITQPEKETRHYTAAPATEATKEIIEPPAKHKPDNGS